MIAAPFSQKKAVSTQNLNPRAPFEKFFSSSWPLPTAALDLLGNDALADAKCRTHKTIQYWETQMNAKTLVATFIMALAFGRMGLAQGGPYLVDYLYPQAWPNPVSTVLPSWLDPDVPSTVLAEQTMYVNNTNLLAQKQKDYYWFQDKDKESGIVHKNLIDNDSCRVWLEYMGYYYPSNGGYDCEFDAIPFSQLDPKCFTKLSGPYCDLPMEVTYVGQVNGTWVAIGGLSRKMGGAFTASQIEQVLDRNTNRNENVLRSDLREELVVEFLSLFPEINPADIPIDDHGDELTSTPDSANTAVVCHILPAIAPEGNGAGRNTFSNAMVVSNHMKKQLTNPDTATGYMPSDAMLFYFEYLAAIYEAKSSFTADAKFSISYLRDLKELDGTEIERLTEEETKIALEYAGMGRAASSKSDRK